MPANFTRLLSATVAGFSDRGEKRFAGQTIPSEIGVIHAHSGSATVWQEHLPNPD